MSRRPTRRQLQRAAFAVLAAIVAAILLRAAPQDPPPTSVQSGDTLEVKTVYDGDTIAVVRGSTLEKVRLLGIDTPETKDPRKPVQCFGKEASDRTKALLTGRRVRLELDPSQGERDRYDRVLAYIWRDDGLFINKTLLEDGYAHEYTYQSVPYKYQTEFKAAAQQAEQAQKGLWSPNTCSGDTKQPAG